MLSPSKWRRRLDLELRHSASFEELTPQQWRLLLRRHRMTCSNFDTVISLDWPHYCYSATTACGGPSGWCYTIQGRHAAASHHRKVALADAAARCIPDVFVERVVDELNEALHRGAISDLNLRYSGSGEMTVHHLPALRALDKQGVRLWGFTRNLVVAVALRTAGIAVIFSCDATTRPADIRRARDSEIPLGYTSTGVDDLPPRGTLVTFPLHRSGRVPEVVDTPSLCPKVVEEYIEGRRRPGLCQSCRRCMSPTVSGA